MIRARRGDVGNLDGLAGHGHASRDAFAPPDRRAPGHGHHLLVEIVSGAQQERLGVLVVLVDGARVGAGELARAGDDRAEHGLEVQRGAEGLADLAERSVSCSTELGELGRAGLQLA